MADRNKRAEPRVEVTEGAVEIHGKTYPLKNCSMRGFLATAYTGDEEEGAKVDISFSVPFVESDKKISGRALVVRVDNDKEELAGLLIVIDEEWGDAFAGHGDDASDEG